MFKKYFGNPLFNFFNTIFYDNNPHSIIDPLTCLIRLCLLEFKPLNTKISIKNNKITYNDPHILQGTIRWTNGDNRDDIHNIYNPIIKAIQWYDSESEDIKNIFKYAVKGLEKLKSSYEENSIITHSIEYYITYIKQNFKNKKVKDEETNTMLIQFKELWSDREINIINNMLLELTDINEDEEDYEEIDNSLIDAIEIILNKKENIVSNIILQNTTKLE
jgi:hypothetical protein